MEKVITKHKLDAKNRDLVYWLGKSSKERIQAVEYLRSQYGGSSKRLQRVIRVVQQTQR